MTIVELKSHIMKNTLNSVYVFVGNEIGIMNIYLEQISKCTNLPIVREDSVVKVYGKCTSKSIFGDVDSLYVIRNDCDIQKHEELYTKLEGEIGKNIIVLLYDKIDSRLKFGKYFKDKIVEFEALQSDVLHKYIKRECDLSDRNIEKLSNIVSNSYDLSMLECNKIEEYAEARGISLDASFEELIRQKVIYQPEQEDVFAFTELVMNRDIRKAITMLNAMIDNGVSSTNILGVLYLKVKCVLLIQVCENDDIQNTTGLSNGEIYYNKKYVGKYNSGQLVNTLKLIAKVVDDIKNGLIDDTIATHYVLVNMV